MHPRSRQNLAAATIVGSELWDRNRKDGMRTGKTGHFLPQHTTGTLRTRGLRAGRVMRSESVRTTVVRALRKDQAELVRG